jgi:lipopolysaccharide biosynthesis protein|tara:strand:- start:472 stop:768 length:297 start_codon:yes stop_codon:yes gene_type:complete
MNNGFFNDEETATHIQIDIKLFEKTLSEYSSSFKKEKMSSKMKEVFRDRELLCDFLNRMKVDLKYLIILTYNYNPSIITPHLKRELNEKIQKESKYPF